jgi:1-acyl-sn-glycerol-3-phosphate acyltransferase
MDTGAAATRAPERAGRAWRLTRRLSRWLLAASYARVEVADAGRIPRAGPTLLVANHTNSLADSLALVLASPRQVAPLAKAPLFQSRFLGPFLRAVNAVPVYREQDVAENAGRGVRANLATFEACRARLRDGRALVLFPEGVSQPQPRLLPLRTGAARIALDACVPVTVVPVGLVFEPPAGRRGGVLVAVGEPFVAEGAGLAKDARRGAIAGLTRRIEAALRGLLAEADSQSDLDALRALAEVRRQERGDPEARSLATRHRHTQVLARGLARLRAIDPAAVEALRAETDAFLRSLAGTGVPLRLLPVAYRRARVLRFSATTLLPALVLAPLALLARLATAPGRALGDVVALRASGAFEDVRAFARGAGWGVGTLVVALAAAALLLALGRPWWALAVLLGLPLLLPVHVVLRDHLHDAKERVRAFFLLAGGSLVGRELLEQRRALAEALDAAGRRLEAAPP